MTFKYQALDAKQVRAIQMEATAEPAIHYSALLPAWEADHVAHTALLTADDGIDHQAAITALEVAITALEVAITALEVAIVAARKNL